MIERVADGGRARPGRLRRHALLAAVAGVYAVALVVTPHTVADGLRSTGTTLLAVALLLGALYFALGLAEEWIAPQAMSRWIGRGAGRARALTVATTAGAWGSGPVWATYPIASLLLARGADVATAVAFLSAWQVVKLTLLPFEIQLLGARFALLRLLACVLIPVPAGLLTEALLAALGRRPRVGADTETAADS